MTIHSLNFVIIITYIRLAKIKIAAVGGGSPKKEDHQMGLTRGVVEPNYSLTQAQHSQDN